MTIENDLRLIELQRSIDQLRDERARDAVEMHAVLEKIEAEISDLTQSREKNVPIAGTRYVLLARRDSGVWLLISHHQKLACADLACAGLSRKHYGMGVCHTVCRWADSVPPNYQQPCSVLWDPAKIVPGATHMEEV